MPKNPSAGASKSRHPLLLPSLCKVDDEPTSTDRQILVHLLFQSLWWTLYYPCVLASESGQCGLSTLWFPSYYCHFRVSPIPHSRIMSGRCGVHTKHSMYQKIVGVHARSWTIQRFSKTFIVVIQPYLKFNGYSLEQLFSSIL
jgi:hypothetical protein